MVVLVLLIGLAYGRSGAARRVRGRLLVTVDRRHRLAATLEQLEPAGREGRMDRIKERFESFRVEACAVLRYLRSTAR